jgi:hypothetical protein
MLKVKDEEAKGEVLEFLKSLRLKQREIETEKKIYYPSISLYLALKHKMFFKNLLLHPMVLEKRFFYDNKKIELTTEELIDRLTLVLEYEFTEEETLSVIERNRIIKVHKKLKNNLEKINVI